MRRCCCWVEDEGEGKEKEKGRAYGGLISDLIVSYRDVSVSFIVAFWIFLWFLGKGGRRERTDFHEHNIKY